GEAAGEQPEHGGDVFDPLGDVPCHQQPVRVRVRAHSLDERSVLGVRDVQVAGGQQAAVRTIGAAVPALAAATDHVHRHSSSLPVFAVPGQLTTCRTV